MAKIVILESDIPTIKQRLYDSMKVAECGCWLWTGYMASTGYGSLSINNFPQGAHRVSFVAHKGQIPDGLHVCHKCDTPLCINPDHLFVGTQKENCDDAKQKDRHSRGERNGFSKLTEEAVREIRASESTLVEIGRKFGIRWQYAWRIKARRAWAHIT